MIAPPNPPLRDARRLGPRRYDMSRELRFEDRLMSALPQSPSIPSSPSGKVPNYFQDLTKLEVGSWKLGFRVPSSHSYFCC